MTNKKKRLHVCLLDRTCWQEMWDYGMPMRIYRKNGKFYNVPILRRISRWRMNKIWDMAKPVEILRSRDDG